MRALPKPTSWMKVLGGRSSALDETAELVKPRLALVDRLIAERLDQGPAQVREAGAWVLNAGGKRLRPTLLLAASRALGYEGDRDVTYAAAVEMIHTATLVHDDIIDHASVRRGRATANSRWGNQLTVLLGDWLFASAMEMALTLGDLGALRLLSRATMLMTEGEVLALGLKGRLDVNRQQYLEITQRKTAELFAAASALPATLVDSAPRWVGPFLDYGRHLGTCFQMVDDLLDITSSQERLGKPVFSDLREGRLTLPFILLLPNLGPDERRAVQGFLAGAELREADITFLREQLERHGALAAARSVAAEYGDRAAEALSPLPPSREKEALMAVPALMLDRTS
jgi:octaprenyl-diphosphate synthase